jgi:hypothetical protein
MAQPPEPISWARAYARAVRDLAVTGAVGVGGVALLALLLYGLVVALRWADAAWRGSAACAALLAVQLPAWLGWTLAALLVVGLLGAAVRLNAAGYYWASRGDPDPEDELGEDDEPISGETPCIEE